MSNGKIKKVVSSIGHCLCKVENARSDYEGRNGFGCCQCGGERRKKHCPGFMHNVETGYIERCDDCNVFEDDREAARAHALVCQCGAKSKRPIALMLDVEEIGMLAAWLPRDREAAGAEELCQRIEQLWRVA